MGTFKVLLLSLKTLEELFSVERKELNKWGVKPNFKT